VSSSPTKTKKQVYSLSISFYAVLMACLEEILMVEFTDDEGDELF